MLGCCISYVRQGIFWNVEETLLCVSSQVSGDKASFENPGFILEPLEPPALVWLICDISCECVINSQQGNRSSVIKKRKREYCTKLAFFSEDSQHSTTDFCLYSVPLMASPKIWFHLNVRNHCRSKPCWPLTDSFRYFPLVMVSKCSLALPQSWSPEAEVSPLVHLAPLQAAETNTCTWSGCMGHLGLASHAGRSFRQCRATETSTATSRGVTVLDTSWSAGRAGSVFWQSWQTA